MNLKLLISVYLYLHSKRRAQSFCASQGPLIETWKDNCVRICFTVYHVYLKPTVVVVLLPRRSNWIYMCITKYCFASIDALDLCLIHLVVNSLKCSIELENVSVLITMKLQFISFCLPLSKVYIGISIKDKVNRLLSKLLIF